MTKVMPTAITAVARRVAQDRVKRIAAAEEGRVDDAPPKIEQDHEDEQPASQPPTS